MKILLFINIIIIMGLISPSLVHSEVLWEKEFNRVKFIQPEVINNLYEGNGSYFILYFGIDSASAKIDKSGKITGNIYPCFLKFDQNGNIIFQNESIIPLIDSLKKADVRINQLVRGYKCKDNELFFDIPQTSGSMMEPNIYSFSASNGNLLNVKGTQVEKFQYNPTLNSIFSNNELYVLSGNLFIFNNQSRIDVHNLITDEFGATLKYRIILNMDDFRDSLQEGTYANNFLMVDDHTFIVNYIGKDNKTVIAKYSYDKSAASNLPTAGTINADLVWFTIYTSAAKNGFQKYILLDNGNLLVHHFNGSLAILDNNGEVIFNKKVFDDSYKNYTITNFMPLKYHTGYYAFWGYYIENKKRDFAVLITDSDWNVVSENKWDFNNKSNSVTDIKETENGNLIVFGNSLYTDSTPSGLSSHYIPYYAELKPNYVSVKDQADNEQIEVSPNPAGDFITINLERCATSSRCGTSGEISIYNTLGEKVMAESIHPMTASHRMNIEPLPRGIYFVKVGGETAKFVKM